jgi:hypothetical protein
MPPTARARACGAVRGQITDVCDASVKNNQVFKRFIGADEMSAATTNKMASYRRQIEENTVTAFLASKFNQRNRAAGTRSSGLLEIKVVTARVVETEGGDVYNMERLLTGQFTKWCNNDGTWIESAFEDGKADRTLLEFMKFSYTFTGGYMLVTDLQGTKNESGLPWADPEHPGYTLTDPGVLCTDRLRFGGAAKGNLGPEFMLRNLERCCRLLGVPVPIVE